MRGLELRFSAPDVSATPHSRCQGGRLDAVLAAIWARTATSGGLRLNFPILAEGRVEDVRCCGIEWQKMIPYSLTADVAGYACKATRQPRGGVSFPFSI
jgi:hypothetical protein